MLTPLDIQKKEFSMKFKGYSVNEVEDFLHLVFDTLEENTILIDELKTKISTLEFEIEKYKSLEKTMSDTLIVAKNTSDEIISGAKQNAHNIIEEAKISANSQLADAHQEIKELNKHKRGLQNELSSFKIRVQAILKSQLDSVDKIDVDFED